MRIGIDVRCLAEKQYSGISEYTYNLLNNLFKIDQQNQYFLFYNAIKAAKIPEFKFANVSIKKFHYPNKIFNLALRFLKIVQIDKLIGGVDVFLIPNFLFLNLSKDCKKILIVHDLSFELYPEFFTHKKRLWHFLISPKSLCRKADRIIAISENTKNDLINFYKISPEKIAVIYPGINDLFFREATDAERQRVKNKYQLPENYIFYLGNLEPRKNIESLILAFGALENKNLSLVIAGGQGWKYKKIYRLWKNSPAKDRIKFLGYVENQDKPALYQLAKAFIYPSIYEGFGLPPVEAMASGTPVITSFNSSLPEAIGPAGLLIDPNNVNEIAKTIGLLLADEKLTADLKSQGKTQAQKFVWEKSAKEILAAINNLK